MEGPYASSASAASSAMPNGHGAAASAPMMSKAEVNLYRLLRSCEKEAAGKDAEQLRRDAKFASFVAVCKEQLSQIVQDADQPGLLSMSTDKVADYERRIKELDQKLDKPAQPNVWQEEGGTLDAEERAPPASDEPLTDSALRKRRGGVTTGDALTSEGSNQQFHLDEASRRATERNRLLQEHFTDQMVDLVGDLKKNTLNMQKAVEESNTRLDSGEVLMERNIANTQQAAAKAGAIFRRSFCTGFFSWLIILGCFGAFLGMVVLIRIT